MEGAYNTEVEKRRNCTEFEEVIKMKLTDAKAVIALEQGKSLHHSAPGEHITVSRDDNTLRFTVGGDEMFRAYYLLLDDWEVVENDY